LEQENNLHVLVVFILFRTVLINSWIFFKISIKFNFKKQLRGNIWKT
jgi:hypothetical protein